MDEIDDILNKESFSKEDLVRLLSTNEEESMKIYEKSKAIKAEQIGRKVYFRGLIEYSNYCSKNCLYCGIRAGTAGTFDTRCQMKKYWKLQNMPMTINLLPS